MKCQTFIWWEEDCNWEPRKCLDWTWKELYKPSLFWDHLPNLPVSTQQQTLLSIFRGTKTPKSVHLSSAKINEPHPPSADVQPCSALLLPVLCTQAPWDILSPAVGFDLLPQSIAEGVSIWGACSWPLSPCRGGRTSPTLVFREEQE